MAQERKHDGGAGRRGFFREAVARAVGPLSDYLENRLQLGPPRVFLRPPGAIEESALVDTCYRCGACIDACPADAIYALDRAAESAAGTPAIDADKAACVVCEGLKCTHVCPSGALLPVAQPADIRMGLAHVYAPLCLRIREEACTICVDQCPLGSDALVFSGDGPPDVLEDGCVGCGVCQLYCPTDPKAIVIDPL